jgi:hypothetical protein
MLYKAVSKALPVMPETRIQDEKKGIVPKHHKLALTLSDLYRDEKVVTSKMSKVHYKERGY